MRATLRSCKAAASSTCWTRWTWEEKEATTIWPWDSSKTRFSTGPISRSWATMPGTSALVESTQNRSTPSSPKRAKERRSVMRPSMGRESILKSPVIRAVPALVRMKAAMASGMEWFTATNSMSKAP